MIASQTQSLIEDIKNCINQCSNYVDENNIFGDYQWTQTIKAFLGRLGSTKGYRICASGAEESFESEWLYDLVWFKENEKGYLIEVPLVVESEWKQNLKDIKFDFEKLLVSKSPLKLMICNCKESTKASTLNYFQESINACPFVNTEEKFLIAILDLVGSDANGFTFHQLSKTIS